MNTLDYSHFYIGGDWIAPAGRQTLDVINPATGQRVGSVPRAGGADIDNAVSAARKAFDDPDGWSRWTPTRRAETLERFATELENRAGEMPQRVSMQNGMPITVAEGFEGSFPPVMIRYYADLMRELPAEERRPGLLGGTTLVVREPIGVVGAITPWNVPQGISSLKVAPALAAGCTVVLKPAEETVLDAMLLAEAAHAAGLPAGVLNVVPGGREVGAHLVAHPGIDKVSFTGSTAAGRSIAETCGRLLRPVTLELGGKSAAIILDDADLTSRLDSLYGVTLLNNGQVCWLNSRILAPRSRYDEIVDVVSDLARSQVVGDPLDRNTTVGPLVSERQRARVEDYIAKGKSAGARLTAGGGRPNLDAGWFVEPTVFADVDSTSVIAQEEIFGPVLTVIPYTDEADAVAIANNTEYGLGGTVWTEDAKRGERIARQVRSGTIGINAYANDPTAPFGGVKSSGLGRELGPEGLAAFLELKSVYLDPTLS
ncbi:aldehyde dehydrogenase [Rhodococcus sp. T7]|uniref:aldehyde dehydrogenase n=1 Tax=Rhodococcus sp. T7 TaxID=627444 RepID=UPI00135B8133|nr:aldehyde dehydrogenase [Rhodococcus sp. T7]KAF0957158.1 Geranial dehydrogenase [Rhodococcus sp. T7]KAF0958996.1 Geranial dehydrogenase [Rhodococcus sp. T7]